MIGTLRLMTTVSLVGGVSALAHAQGQPPQNTYEVGVVSESGDILTWLRPTANGLVVARVIPLGINPMDPDGPHNLAVSPDGRSYYVTLAHGVPWGTLWRFDAQTDTVIGFARVERFPTTIALTPDGTWAFVANSDFHGERPRVNPVSIVHTPTMTTVADLPACDMPHGVKATRSGTRVWVSCMHSDELLELDAQAFEIVRRISVGSGHAGSTPRAHPASADALGRECGPTFVSASADEARLFVACHVSGQLQVWNVATGTLEREVPTGAGPYNVEPSPDGRWILVTNKKAQSVSIFDAVTLIERKRIRTSKPIVHGIAFSPDGRRAYISAESIGSDPGAVDVLDLLTLERIASVSIPAQPAGIAVLPR